jgi:hypothetical protein
MKLTLGHVECAIQIDRHLGERNEREYKTFFPVPELTQAFVYMRQVFYH